MLKFAQNSLDKDYIEENKYTIEKIEMNWNSGSRIKPQYTQIQNYQIFCNDF